MRLPFLRNRQFKQRREAGVSTWLLDTKNWTLGSGHKELDTRKWTQRTRHRLLAPWKQIKRYSMGVTSDEKRLFTRSFVEIGTRIEQPKLILVTVDRDSRFPSGGRGSIETLVVCECFRGAAGRRVLFENREKFWDNDSI